MARPSARIDKRSRDGERYEAMLAALMHFRVVVRTMRDHYRRVERACGVSGADVWALAQVAACPGIKVSELAHQLAVHQSTASNMVERLERSGLVSRLRSADDRRVVRLQATARGRRIVERAPAPVRGALQQALMELPLARVVALRDALATLLRQMHGRNDGAESLVLADLIGHAPKREPAVPRRRAVRSR